MCSNSVGFKEPYNITSKNKSGYSAHTSMVQKFCFREKYFWPLLHYIKYRASYFILLKVIFNAIKNVFIFPSVKLKSFGTNECRYI